MIFPISNIHESLKNLGLGRADTVMIHGDAGLAAQYKWNTSEDRVTEFLSTIISYFDKGTVVVPTFSYSATKGEVFLPLKTPSEVGLFSEKFRLFKGVKRSHHSIFSVGCIGEKAKIFSESSTKDCFGPQTFFDKFHENNGKILTLGCSFDRVTFVHYVEQSAGVPYRYLKQFNGIVQTGTKISKEKVSYFVRDLNLHTEIDLKLLEDTAINEKKMIKSRFGRYTARLISASDFYDIAIKLLDENQHALIKESLK
jgi:aminoglycoside 3-N-acetyltransferase